MSSLENNINNEIEKFMNTILSIFCNEPELLKNLCLLCDSSKHFLLFEYEFDFLPKTKDIEQLFNDTKNLMKTMFENSTSNVAIRRKSGSLWIERMKKTEITKDYTLKESNKLVIFMAIRFNNIIHSIQLDSDLNYL